MRFGDVIRGEVIKLRTYRPLMLTIFASAVLTLGYCLLEAKPAERLGLSQPETAAVYAMANLSFFAAIVGVLIASAEHGGGQLSTTVLAVARRGRMLTAKLILSAAVTTGLGLLLAVYLATVVQAPLGAQSVYATGTTGTLLSSLALAVCSWTALGIISTSLACIIRSQTVAIASMVVVTFGGTPLMMALPIFQYLPSNAGVLLFIDRGAQTSDWLTPPDITVPVAAATVAAWCCVAIAAAAAVLLRRDIGARQVSLD